LERVQQTFTNG